MERHFLIDRGKGSTPPEGKKNIRYLIVYDVKHDGSHKSSVLLASSVKYNIVIFLF
jgi:hypothetical protein